MNLCHCSQCFKIPSTSSWCLRQSLMILLHQLSSVSKVIKILFVETEQQMAEVYCFTYLTILFVNNLMLDGKKTKAFGIFYDAMEIVEKKVEEQGPVDTFKKALETAARLGAEAVEIDARHQLKPSEMSRETSVRRWTASRQGFGGPLWRYRQRR